MSIDWLARDVRHAVRRLIKDWPFSTGAIALLSLGIGINSAVFSLLNATLLKPHPFAASSRLVNIYQNDARSGEPEAVSYPAFVDLQKETAVFAGVAASNLDAGRYQMVDAQGNRSSFRSGLIEYTSANYLDVIGLRPSLGRWFRPGETDPVVVLGWTAWERDFGSDPNVLGRTLFVGGAFVQVIGVGPRVLNSSQNPAVATSLWMAIPRTRALEDRRELMLQVRARLRDGISVEQAQSAMNVMAQRLAADHPDSDPKRGITVLPTDDVQVHPRERQLKPASIAAMIIVGLVLAIACSNLATLLLVRSSARTAEISVRLALGASRWQLVRQLLMETLVLASAGAAGGVALAHGALRYLESIDLPVLISMNLDYRVLAYAVGVALLCGTGFGLTPALASTRVNVAGALREEKGSSSGALSLARGWFNVKNVLVAGQVAASFLLLVGAALAMAILSGTQQRGVGYRPDGIAVLMTDPRYAGYDVARAVTLLEDLKRRVAAMPGVESVFITNGLPVDGEFEQDFWLEAGERGNPFRVEGRWAGPGYFHTLGIPVLFGRVFDEHDLPGSREVIVVSEAFARQYFGDADAVGKRIYFDGRQVEIVGVVGNARSIDFVAEAPKRSFYRCEAQGAVMPTTIVARVSRNEANFVGLMQQEVRRLHPELPVTHAITMRQRQEMELTLFRIAVWAFALLGGLGLLLAVVGLYAVVAYAVAQRTSELGIRIALGARAGNLMWLVVRDVTALVLAGIAIGAAVSWTGITALEAAAAPLLGVDVRAIAIVAAIIVICGAAAAFVPARRAVRIDPMVAIRR